MKRKKPETNDVRILRFLGELLPFAEFYDLRLRPGFKSAIFRLDGRHIYTLRKESPGRRLPFLMKRRKRT
jgi:hypothetical protein